jgi:hypothetical protein
MPLLEQMFMVISLISDTMRGIEMRLVGTIMATGGLACIGKVATIILTALST